MFDGKAFGQEVVAAVKSHVDKSLAPILERIDAIEAAMKAQPAVEEEDLAIVKDEVLALRKAIAELPAPAEVPTLPDIPAMVAEAVASLPPALPGKSVTVEELAPLIAESVQKAVAATPAPKDGCGVKDLLIDRDGALVASMDDGRMKSLGRVVGKDADPVDMAAVERSITEMVKAIPAPKDGNDGVGFDDMDLVDTGEGVVLRFTRGDVVKDFRLPIVVDRGVWKDGPYNKGDGCTWGGSFWICQEDGVTDKPDSGKGWRLAVKKGRDGKDGTLKAEKAQEPLKVG